MKEKQSYQQLIVSELLSSSLPAVEEQKHRILKKGDELRGGKQVSYNYH